MPIASSVRQNNSAKEKLKKVVISCMIGNALEWYDFALYGYFAAAIGRAILPPSQDTISILLKSYAIFFLGFIMRPLGALLFGYIGDHYGRKKALMLSIYCMAIPTTLIGLLPTYAQIGAWAALLLTVLRLFQGLSMGGEFTGSMIFIVEHAPQEKKGFWGSWASFSVVIGLIIGSGISALISFLVPPDQLEVWGWRIPFLLSVGGSVVGAYMRKSLDDTREFNAHKTEQARPHFYIKDLFSKHWKTIVRVVFIDFSIAVGFFLICIHTMTYLQEFVGFSYRFASVANTISMFAFALAIFLAGSVSDRYTPKKVMQTAVISFMVMALPCFYGLISGVAWIALTSQVVLAFIMGVNFAPMPALLVSLFPLKMRYSGMSLAHNLSMAIFGGSAPHIATFLIKHTGYLVMPGVLLFLAALCSFCGLYKVKTLRD
jgi:MHS family proline/betaine transporter-like MFS transporter